MTKQQSTELGQMIGMIAIGGMGMMLFKPFCYLMCYVATGGAL